MSNYFIVRHNNKSSVCYVMRDSQMNSCTHINSVVPPNRLSDPFTKTTQSLFGVLIIFCLWKFQVCNHTLFIVLAVINVLVRSETKTVMVSHYHAPVNNYG